MSIFSSQTVNGHRQAIRPSAAYAAEITKHESLYTEFGPPGRPYLELVGKGEINPDYPTMMYKAARPKSGGDATFEKQTAETETERTRLEAMGFVWGGPAAALASLESLEEVMATAAAERNFSDRKMSPEAQAEAARKDERTIKHLGEIPADPLPAKNQIVSRVK